jgi:RNA polymerase sigma-70 factor (ECF subfamily)
MTTRTEPSPLPASDSQLLTRFASGERAVLEELFDRYRTPAFRVAYRLLGHEADALDAVQEGFIKVLSHLDSFQGRSSFKTWLLRIVSNAALDLGRQRGRREMLSLDGPDGDAETLHAFAPGDPTDGLHQKDLRRLLDQALAALPEVQRRTFVLHVDGGLSYREVAEVMEISIGTVMSRLFYARQKLRAYLVSRLPSVR